MSTACMIAGLALAAVFNTDDWTCQTDLQGQIGGQTETIQALYKEPLFAFGVPETETTQAGLLVISELDLTPRFSVFSIPGPYTFTSVVDDTVSPEIGFFTGRLLSEYYGPDQASLLLVPLTGSDTPAISYRGSTIFLEAGEYLLTPAKIPEPGSLLLVVAGAGLLIGMRNVARH